MVLQHKKILIDSTWIDAEVPINGTGQCDNPDFIIDDLFQIWDK